MQAIRQLIARTWRYATHDSMRRNAFFLMLAAAVGAGIGFFFWLVCARLFAATDVGYAVSLISCVTLTSAVTALGLNNAVIRFLPHHDRKSTYVGTVFGLAAFSAVVCGALVVLIIGMLAPQLLLLVTDPAMFGVVLTLVVITTLSMVADAVLLAYKDAKHIFWKTVWSYPLRLVLPFLFVGFGAQGIVLVYGLTALLALTYQGVIIARQFRGQRFGFDMTALAGTYRFTAGNLAGTIFGILPSTLVPLIVLTRLGPEQAAFFYMPMQIAGFLTIICSSNAQSFMAEASHEKTEAAFLRQLVRAARHLFSLLIPAAALLAIAGLAVLYVYGPQYAAAGKALLALLCAASVFIGVNWLGDALLNVQKRPLAYGVMNAINALLVCGLVYIGAAYGLVQVGLAWLTAQALTVVIYGALQLRVLRAARLLRT